VLPVLILLAGQQPFFLIEQQAFLDGSHHFLNAQKHRTLQGIMPGTEEGFLQAFQADPDSLRSHPGSHPDGNPLRMGLKSLSLRPYWSLIFPSISSI
jgi:hypothetical protein